jgi:GTP-binding protein
MLLKVKANEAAKSPVAKEIVYQAKVRFTVEKEDNTFYVSGPEVVKWVAMTNFDNRDAAERFYKILQRMGVIRELKKQGVRNGDSVFCEDRELIFELEGLGART